MKSEDKEWKKNARSEEINNLERAAAHAIREDGDDGVISASIYRARAEWIRRGGFYADSAYRD